MPAAGRGPLYASACVTAADLPGTYILERKFDEKKKKKGYTFVKHKKTVKYTPSAVPAPMCCDG